MKLPQIRSTYTVRACTPGVPLLPKIPVLTARRSLAEKRTFTGLDENPRRSTLEIMENWDRNYEATDKFTGPYEEELKKRFDWIYKHAKFAWLQLAISLWAVILQNSLLFCSINRTHD